MPRNAFRQKGIEEVNCDCEKFNLFFLSFLKKHLLTISVLNFDLVKNEASKISNQSKMSKFSTTPLTSNGSSGISTKSVSLFINRDVFSSQIIDSNVERFDNLDFSGDGNSVDDVVVLFLDVSSSESWFDYGFSGFGGWRSLNQI